MGNVSKPLIALLVGTVAFFALWTVALKGGASGGASSKSLGTYQAAIDKAHQAASLSNAVNAAHGADPQSTGAANPQGATASAPGSQAASSAAPAVSSRTRASKSSTSSSASSQHLASAARQRLNKVQRALVANKVVALLFFNPAASDDRAVAQELASIPARGGKVVKLAVPLSEVSNYGVVTDQVPVSSSPTLVIVDPDQQAQTIVGFADRFEIGQRVDDALSVK